MLARTDPAVETVMDEVKGQRRRREKRDVPRVPKRMLKDPPSNPLSNLTNSLLQLSGNSLTLECFDSVRVGSSGHNNECDNGSLGSSFLESVVESWWLALER